MDGNSQKPLIGQKKLSEADSNNALYQQQNLTNYPNVQSANQRTQQAQQLYPNQGYPPVQGYMPPNSYPPNQGFIPYQAYPSQNYLQPNQGFVPGSPNQQYILPPPYPQYQNQSYTLNLKIPSNITPAHPSYGAILQSLQTPCPICQSRDSDFVSSKIGCSAISWSVCLFCFTGILCFWIPLILDDCKDVQVNCIRCGYMKCRIEKSCC